MRRINKRAKASVKDLHQVEPQSDRYQRPEEDFITRYITAVAGEAKEREHRRWIEITTSDIAQNPPYASSSS